MKLRLFSKLSNHYRVLECFHTSKTNLFELVITLYVFIQMSSTQDEITNDDYNYDQNFFLWFF